MLNERFAGKELEDEILKMMKEAYEEGCNQGFIDSHPVFDHSIGGFHGD
jgi:hypothetical protein